ncbi:MAG: mannose-1-phosphate guanylyltransferase [Phycisphaeraceae bacterium]
MRYAMIMAGGSGTRLWPMSRAKQPKQLIPFIHGRSLLQIAFDRLSGLVPTERAYICAGESHRAPILSSLEGFDPQRYLGEPEGRDTVNAVAFAAAVIGKLDPDAVIAVFTADHVIEPVDRFQQIVKTGFDLAEKHGDALITFGITPTHASPAYGYLQLGKPFENGSLRVEQFHEKPEPDVAAEYFAGGPTRYLWNSGMFVWRASALMDCIRRYMPESFEKLTRIAAAWGTPEQEKTIHELYPTLKKISVDFAVMQPAAEDPTVKVIAVPMPLRWLDVGSWPALAQVCDHDENANATSGGRHVIEGSARTLIASSDPNHVIAAVGCEDLIIVHTPQATLVCHKSKAEAIKNVHKQVGERFGEELI